MRRFLAGLLAVIALAGPVMANAEAAAVGGVQPATDGARRDPNGMMPATPAVGRALADPPPVHWEPLGGRLLGGPAAASWGAGRLDVFVTGTDGQLWHRWYQGRWSAWGALGGRSDAGPAVASWAPGRLDVFVTGTDGQLWHRWYDRGWSRWEALGGVIRGAPSVVSWGPGRLDVFVTGTDGQLWHRWYQGGWSGWEALGGRSDTGPAVASWAPGRLDVFVTGTDGQLWHRWYQGGWSGWEALGGRSNAGPAAVSWGAGRLDVFVTGTDGQSWHRWYAGRWSGWETLGGRLDGGPAVASWGPGRLDVFARGIDAQLWHTWYDGKWPRPQIVSVVVDGQGNGHGRGLSQWGAFGLSVNHGWGWQRILDHYYGGTVSGSAGNDVVGVRLLALDSSPTTAVISTTGRAVWNGTSWATLMAHEVAPNQFQIWAATTPACPGEPSDRRLLATVAGPVTFTTPVDQSAAAGGDVLGLCQPNGSVIHYRGSITALDDRGANHTVNHVAMENYLRGVLPREVPASWGNSAGGAGMNSLRAMAVAARTFGHSQGRYPYADTCDSSACQVYGGAASRPSSASAPTTREHVNTNTATTDTRGVVRRWPDGRLASGEYSATHGPYSAGWPYPVVDDSASNVPGNPRFTWRRTVDAAALESRYALGNLTGAWTERDPGSPYHGVWGHRVVLQGSARTVVVPGLAFRTAFGFPSHGYTITGLNWSG